MNEITLSKFVEIGVKNNQISQYLYKYRTVDAVKKLLQNNSLWFSSPKEFNDPFDCQIVPDTNNSEEDIREFIRINTNRQLSERKVHELASEIFNKPGKWKSTIEGTFSKIINSTGICCFTKTNNNLLMWAHYTDSHKGVCLKFDILEDCEFFVYPFPVNYRGDYPMYNHLTDKEKLIKDVVLSKSIDWQYENEIRVLRIKTNGLLSFKKNALVEIIFGLNCSEENIQEIIELSKRNGYQIKLKKAIKKEREFALEIKDL